MALVAHLEAIAAVFVVRRAASQKLRTASLLGDFLWGRGLCRGQACGAQVDAESGLPGALAEGGGGSRAEFGDLDVRLAMASALRAMVEPLRK
jgi:hypothetical protein